MGKGRLEAFSDAVIAIALTIMVLELHVPHGTDWAALRPLVPAMSAYVLRFVFLGIYWNNHHHMLHAAERVNGTILWANLHLLFWLSLFLRPGWIAENRLAPVPTAAYGIVRSPRRRVPCCRPRSCGSMSDSKLGAAVGAGLKEKVSLGSC
jgi:uncharacterized membrane protein